MSELAKTFEPGAIEAKWYEHWESEGLFRPERGDAEPYTIIMPPPNVTGVLHIGHALDNTLQDILIRKARLEGKDALWVPGMDHAGIATQMVVERQLDLEQKKRTDMGREAFVERVWEWKEESGGQITRQLRRLGSSCDWNNERFTMDEGFSKAVTHVFVELYKRGLLYRDKRLVNWDPRFETAISDLEVEQKEQAGHFWHLRYPLADGSGSIEVATTRPETMLADMAVAVHPDDDRYRDMVGKTVKLPITGREVPVITDEHADPELGSGAVKITPGHDFNDFEVGKRAGIEPADMLNMLSSKGEIVQTADGKVPEALIGLDRFDARKRVVEMLEEEGALIRTEDRVIQAPYGDRSGVIIEPWLTDQWYVDAETLAKPALEAVRSGDINVVPETWKKTWYNWLENIQPWCVSRQLWWGHRIPAWYDDAGNAYVAMSEEEAQAQAGDGVALRQDEDVLDTWFSSALWPFATLGWPEQTQTLERHYPNDVLISGFDIIFFWDARMAMQGFEFMGEKPWKTLYLHGLVRDAQGQKMSKSKGNTVDPLDIVDRYGADALRFTLCAMESQGRDIKLDEKRVEGYRNFATKLWNAARFLQSNGVGASESIAAPAAEKPVNRWIIGEVVETLAKLEKAFDELRFDGMADAIYHFAWGTYCDWYVELIKGEIDAETKAVAAWAFDQILVMLHPFMPFVTEELWHSMSDPAHPRPYDLIVAKWPQPEAQVDASAKQEIDWAVALVSEVRALRAELNIPWSSRLVLHPLDGGATGADAALDRLAKAEWGEAIDDAPAGSAQIVVRGKSYVVPLADAIDLDAERARLSKSVEAAEKEATSLQKRLENANFVEKAKPEAVEKARADHAARSEEAQRLRAALERLG